MLSTNTNHCGPSHDVSLRSFRLSVCLSVYLVFPHRQCTCCYQSQCSPLLWLRRMWQLAFILALSSRSTPPTQPATANTNSFSMTTSFHSSLRARNFEFCKASNFLYNRFIDCVETIVLLAAASSSPQTPENLEVVIIYIQDSICIGKFCTLLVDFLWW